MKMFAIAATALTDNQSKTIGFAGSDDASGGYPYFSETPIFFHEHSFTKAFMDNVADWGRAFGIMSDGGVYLRSDANIFMKKYREMMRSEHEDVFAFQVHLVQYDFTIALIPETTVLRSISVSGRVPPANGKSLLPPFYNAVEMNNVNKQTIWFKTSKVSPTESLYLFYTQDGEGVFIWNEDKLTRSEAMTKYPATNYHWIELVD